MEEGRGMHPEDSKRVAREEPSLGELKQSPRNCKLAGIGIGNCQGGRGRSGAATKYRGHKQRDNRC